MMHKKLKLEKETFVKGTINYMNSEGITKFTIDEIDAYEEYYVDQGHIITDQKPTSQILRELKQLRMIGGMFQILGNIPNLGQRIQSKQDLRFLLKQYDMKKEQLQIKQLVLK